VDEATARTLLGLAEELAPGLRGLDRADVFAQLDAREDELVAALTWFVEARRTDDAIRLVRSLAPFWQATRRLDVATGWFERVLALDGGDDALRGRALAEAGFLWFLRGDDAAARASYARARELGAPSGAALALALTGLARIALRDGQLDEARRLAFETLALSDSGADPVARGSAAHVLGVTAQMQGDLEEARRWMSERVQLAREDGSYAILGLEASNLAMVERQLGDLDRAEELLREALEIFRRRRDEWAIPFGLNGLAAVAVERSEFERAATLAAAGDAMVDAQGAAWPPDELEHYERTVAAAQAALEPSTLERARDHGRGLTPDEAVAYALSRPA
jgi:tetratricopeptide (TPR) repeat protein